MECRCVADFVLAGSKYEMKDRTELSGQPRAQWLLYVLPV